LFNDSIITEFDVNNLENECFGGETESFGNSNQSNNYNGQFYNDIKDKTRNAYMLVYQKKLTKPIKLYNITDD